MKKCIFFFLISCSIFGQTIKQREIIVKDYDKKEIYQFRNNLIDLNSKIDKKKSVFLKNNPDFKPNFYSGNRHYYLSDISNDGKPIFLSSFNNGATLTTRARKLWSGGGLGLNVQGQNMIAGVWEIGTVNLTHSHFQNRAIQKDFSTAELADHATHVTGTIIQNKTTAPTSRGIAFNGSVWANDIANEFIEILDEASEGLLVSNHSYGIPFLNENVLQVPTLTAGKYENYARIVDRIHELSPYYLAVYASGNERDLQGAINNKGGYDLLSYRTVSKNSIVVGAINSVSSYTGPSSVGMATFSNWGPTDDGRIKPELVAKGVGVVSTTGSAIGSTATLSMQGTSMAAPGITGSLLLLQQHFNDVNGKFMLASTLKGLALHTADEAGNSVGPDYSFGWGLMNCENAALAISNNGLTSRVEEFILNQGESKTFIVTALGGTTPVMGSISWTDPQGVVNTAGEDDPTPALVNDLDIRITKASTTYFPWKLSAASPSNAATTGDNIVDPFEKIQIDNPSGDYIVTVTHKGTLLNPQKFSLVMTGVSSPFTIRTSQPSVTTCATNSAIYQLEYKTINTTPTTFSVTGLPVGVNAVFSPNTLSANGTIGLTLSNLNGVANGTYNFQVIGNNGTVSKSLELTLNVFSSNFNSLSNFLPENAAIDVSVYPNLSWDADINSQSYTVEVATDIAFTNIVQTKSVVTNLAFLDLLNVNTNYFWRVKSVNLCGASTFSNVLQFKTVNLECSTITNNTVSSIADVENTIVTSTLTYVNPSITSIYDIDVSLNLTHTYVQDMTLSITSPQGTTVVLQNEACGNQDNINAIYDDNGVNIFCSPVSPAISGRIKSFEVLSAFNGENPNGTWILTVDDPYNGDGGTINAWGLDVCKQITLGNEEFNESNLINVYPNPTRGFLNYNSLNDIQKVSVSDVLGKLVSISVNNGVIDMTKLQTGIYFVKFEIGDKSIIKKIIKN